MKRLHLVVLMAAACVPGPLDETGKQCSALRPCGEGFTCVDLICQDAAFDAGLPDAGLDAGAGDAGDAGLTDAGNDAGAGDGGADAGVDSGFPFGVNLLANPGFELVTSDGGERFWRATTGALSAASPARTGLWSGRLTVTSAANPAVQSEVVGGETTVGMFFCAEAWVRHDLDAGPTVTMTIRDRYTDAGIDSSNGAQPTLVRGEWRRVEEKWQSYGNAGIDVRFTTSRLDPDASVLIDSVVLMRMPGTTCVFP